MEAAPKELMKRISKKRQNQPQKLTRGLIRVPKTNVKTDSSKVANPNNTIKSKPDSTIKTKPDNTYQIKADSTIKVNPDSVRKRVN
ncbi:hypothetical protein [Sphingobacterium daejeonense]|uniref:hypothetical protein n=1 Tax=Sphingobacterium daejeonense TaxID=371142 RepID=UPI0010C36FDC|nr:hypothetical protein [Sphingobacterium daejeonense]VTP89672.1 Uncharacterised protein [Sphingobacterium daejeonense]